MRKFVAVLGIALLTSFAVPAAAHADDTNYTPITPTDPTLAGSTAVVACEADAAWIDFSITLTDPDGLSTTNTAVLFMTDGTNSTEVPLGELQDNHLEGRVLWPGASVDAAGKGNGWPGWVYQNGQWVETSGNFAWTRGEITAEIRTNLSVSVPLSYPPSTPTCVTSPGGMASTVSLPATGLSAMVLPIGIAGGAVLVIGLGLLAARRRAHR